VGKDLVFFGAIIIMVTGYEDEQEDIQEAQKDIAAPSFREGSASSSYVIRRFGATLDIVGLCSDFC
jgi:hypothetical protein